MHAEVQLATFHRQQKTHPSPRTIGTSKAACYLCNLFLSLHPQYRISATHGVIFDAWTIPDVISYSAEDRKELRDVVRSMQNTLEARAGKHNCRSLQFPIQNGIYHVPSLPSLAGTVISPVAPIIGKSHSIVQTNSRTQEAVVVPLVGSVEEAATIPLIDHQVESTPEIIIRTPSQKSVIADEQHREKLGSKRKKAFVRSPNLTRTLSTKEEQNLTKTYSTWMQWIVRSLGQKEFSPENKIRWQLKGFMKRSPTLIWSQ